MRDSNLKDTPEAEQVTMTAGGNMVRPSSIMRRHEDGIEDHHQHHHSHQVLRAKAMFKTLDLNGDGKVTGAELKANMKKKDFHSKALEKLMSMVEDSNEDGTTQEEFLNAVHLVKEQNALHHKAEELIGHNAHHHAHVQEHHALHPKEFLEESENSEETFHDQELQGRLLTAEKNARRMVLGKDDPDGADPTANWVTCGGHKAPSCEQCTSTDSSGKTVFDHGGEWCNGDCIYGSESGGSLKCHLAGNANVIANAGPSLGHATPLPDILNPAITDKDTGVINDAATDAIAEENAEAAAKLQKEEEGEGGGKFWLIVIITFSVILGICAIVSVVALAVFCFMSSPEDDKLQGQEDDEGEALMEGEEEGEEGEEAAGES
jgi:hypothetical protein